MPKKKKRVRQCLSFDRDFVKKLESLSSETGVPKSRILENCFGNGEKLNDFEKFCASAKKRKEEK